MCTPIEELCEMLGERGVGIDEVLVPEQCASIFLPSGNYHVTIMPMPAEPEDVSAKEPWPTEENPTPYATAVAYEDDHELAAAVNQAERRGYSNLEACRFEVITSDLHTLPMCIVQATSFEEMCEQLGMWSFEGPLSGESVGKVREYVYQAKPPSDGLLGTCLTEQFTLPELAGMRIHVQIS